MESVVLIVFCLAIGYLMYWTVVNEKRDPNGGHEGWFALKPPPQPKDAAKAKHGR